MVRYVLLPLITRFDRFHEYIFLLAIGWCLGMAEAAVFFGLSEEIGAFIAGITIATSPIAQYIAVNLKPLRDFFLILFFFAVGARFDLALLNQVLAPALVLAALVLGLKPVVYRFLLQGVSEKRSLAWDLGFRLGQASEFSLLIAYVGGSRRPDLGAGRGIDPGHHDNHPAGIVLHCGAQLRHPHRHFRSLAKGLVA